MMYRFWLYTWRDSAYQSSGLHTRSTDLYFPAVLDSSLTIRLVDTCIPVNTS